MLSFLLSYVFSSKARNLFCYQIQISRFAQKDREVNRKGKNNTTEAFEGDVGSTWGIGSKDGGHKDIHPQLGTLEDFKELVQAAKELGIEIAMDYALQAAPDHPWVKKHPNWFKWRPDGTVQYAENPPKK